MARRPDNIHASGCPEGPISHGLPGLAPDAGPAHLAPGIASALAPKRRGRGLALRQRLRLVAMRLEAGLRETPQWFLPFGPHHEHDHCRTADSEAMSITKR